MSFKALVTRYKISTIIISIILGLSLIAGGITAGILLTKQSNPPADAATGSVYINADGTEATSSDYDWSLAIYYSSASATTCRLDKITRKSSSTATSIVIPETVTISSVERTITSMRNGTRTVNENTGTTSISNSVFYAMRANLSAVTLPNTITNIGNCAFYQCTKLTNIVFPSSVTTIGSYAFYGSGLINVEIPDTVKTISSNRFKNSYNRKRSNKYRYKCFSSLRSVDKYNSRC